MQQPLFNCSSVLTSHLALVLSSLVTVPRSFQCPLITDSLEVITARFNVTCDACTVVNTAIAISSAVPNSAAPLSTHEQYSPIAFLFSDIVLSCVASFILTILIVCVHADDFVPPVPTFNNAPQNMRSIVKHETNNLFFTPTPETNTEGASRRLQKK